MDLSKIRLGDELSVLGLEGELERLMSATQTLDGKLDEINATAVSPDRLIRVTVSGRGELRELELDAGIYGTQDAPALAAAIRTTISQATANAASKVAAAYDELEEELS